MSDDLQLARDLFDLERRIGEKLAELKSDTLELNKAAYKGIADLTARLAPLEVDLVERKATAEKAAADAADAEKKRADDELSALRSQVETLTKALEMAIAESVAN